MRFVPVHPTGPINGAVSHRPNTCVSVDSHTSHSYSEPDFAIIVPDYLYRLSIQLYCLVVLLPTIELIITVTGGCSGMGRSLD